MMILPLLALMTATTPSDSLGATSDAPAPALVDAPLEPAKWGLGFRVYGTAPEIRIYRILSDCLSIGINASWNGSYDENETRQAETRWKFSNSTSTSQDVEYTLRNEYTTSTLAVRIPVEWVLACRGPLCAVASAGPSYQLYVWNTQTDSKESSSSRISTTESTSHRIGAMGAVGMRWEFLPGLALASSFGADAWYSFGEQETESTGWSQYPDHSARNVSSKGFGTDSWFGGIGLDAWF